MVTGCRVLLLIRILMLLVHDNQAQVLKRKEEGRTDPQYQHRLVAMQQLVPDLHPLVVRELRVVDQ